MRFLIWGTGAIGGTMGAHLAHAGHDVTVVDCDRDHVSAIQREGLRVEGPIAELTVHVPAYTPDTLTGEWNTIILATKAQHTQDAAVALLPHLEQDGCVISAQNGLNELAIASVVGQPRTVGAFVNFGADYIAPGVIHHGGRGAVVVGELDGRLSPRVRDIREAWADFDRGAIETQNIWGYLWGKEAYGAMLFATALTNESIADALADARYRALYIAIGREILSVALARGVTTEAFDGFNPAAFLPSATDDAAGRSIDDLVTFNRRSAKTHSGIWRDLAIRKRPTEVDAQLGIVVRLASESGVPTPLTARLVQLVHDIETGVRTQSLETLDVLAALCVSENAA